ncbi:MAG TPA: RcnB family protein [Steroidobacteraceae bacterium]|nr:RcnB family protein [Steroidobacteraceae bacterium]
MKRMIMGTMVLSLAVGSLALADPPGYDQHHDQHHHVVEHHRTVAHHAHAGFATGRYVHPHGYHAHTWRKGDRLPPAYRGSAYVIPDVAVYHLRPAPVGFYWIRVDNNAVLASVATGAVVDVHVNLFP